MTFLLTFLTMLKIIEHREETLYSYNSVTKIKLMVSEAGPNFLTPIIMKVW